MKLDAKFYGEIRKAKDDSIVPGEEYVVFLAKDNAFWYAIHDYLRHCQDLGCDQDQINAVIAMIMRMGRWRLDHPDRLKKPDAKGEKLLEVGE